MCIISIIRLIVLSRLYDVDVTCNAQSLKFAYYSFTDIIDIGNYVNAAIWSAAEPSMGTYPYIGLIYFVFATSRRN